VGAAFLKRAEDGAARSEAAAPARSPALPGARSPEAVLALQRAAGNRATRAVLARMAACPAHLNDSDPIPGGWKPYFGDTRVFHCGYRVILEDRAPTASDPMNECVYDHSGNLVDASHPDARCGGTPDQYDASKDPLKHTFLDSGGIVAAGWGAFWGSRAHDAQELDSWYRHQRARYLYGAP
jgi:hypothetical protein